MFKLKYFRWSIISLAFLFPANPVRAFTIFEASGSDATDIQSTVDAFRNSLGTLNANTPVVNPDGRREINWDGAPDSVSDPNSFPGNFFNANVSPRARGIEFSTPGSELLLSSTAASGQPVGFGFPTDFIPFSPERLFSPVGSTITNVRFFSPADTTTPATSNGIGVVFNDVEGLGDTFMEIYDIQGNLLAQKNVLTSTNGGLSFLGFVAEPGDNEIFSVRIQSGSLALLGNGSQGSSGIGDGVAMDDFIFGEPQPVAEPQPVPEPLTIFGSLLAGNFIIKLRGNKKSKNCSFL